MNHSLSIGFSFGLTSGIITTLGLMVGLHSGTHSQLVVIGGILTIAIADAFSDALGIHVSEESENKHSAKEIWQSTAATFASKFFVALSFVLPVLLLQLSTAILVGAAWGLLLLAALSYFIAKKDGKKAKGAVAEHLFIAVCVIVLTHFAGDAIGRMFG